MLKAVLVHMQQVMRQAGLEHTMCTELAAFTVLQMLLQPHHENAQCEARQALGTQPHKALKGILLCLPHCLLSLHSDRRTH